MMMSSIALGVPEELVAVVVADDLVVVPLVDVLAIEFEPGYGMYL